MSRIKIKTCFTLAEFEKCVEIQKDIWRLPDYRDCTPDHVLLASVEAGGLVLGAWDGKILTGFSLSIPAWSEKDGFYYYSHILGVLPEYQGRSIGEGLKWAQREYALKKNIKKIVWTYDPLLYPNARLNFQKLGGICREYRENVYGEVMGGSGLTGGIPSDRFFLEWYIDSEKVKNKDDAISETGNTSKLFNIARIEVVNTLPQMLSFDIPEEGSDVFVEIPAGYQQIIDEDKKLALEWRLKSRSVFNKLFNNGYVAVDFLSITDNRGKKCGYIFERRTEENL